MTRLFRGLPTGIEFPGYHGYWALWAPFHQQQIFMHVKIESSNTSGGARCARGFNH